MPKPATKPDDSDFTPAPPDWIHTGTTGKANPHTTSGGAEGVSNPPNGGQVTGEDSDFTPYDPNYKSPTPPPDPSGRTPTGEPAPGDNRNGFQRTLDNLTTPDPRREEWQGPVRNASDSFSRGIAENVLPFVSHPLKSGL